VEQGCGQVASHPLAQAELPHRGVEEALEVQEIAEGL
jgi:hypothetical protein